MTRFTPETVAAFLASAFAATDDAPRTSTSFIVGDPTVRNGTKGEQGWGDLIVAFFDPTKMAGDQRRRI